jgi:peptidoglycan/LPS O-acetylase OafA/YrhL
MSPVLESFVLEPLLGVLFLIFITAIAAALVLLFDWAGGTLRLLVNPSSSKLASLEGLRGVLAFSVVAHHACCGYYFLQGPNADTHFTGFFNNLGLFGVLQFFFLSGFLFWRKLMKNGKISFANFYLSRLVRIGPVYYACFVTAFLISLYFNGFKLQVSLGTLCGSLLSWFLFTIGGNGPVNHLKIADILPVTWTLAQEWLFYLALPFLAWFARKPRRMIFYLLAFGACHFAFGALRFHLPESSPTYAADMLLFSFARFMLIGFGGGILVASFELRIRNWLSFARPWRKGLNWILLLLYAAYLVPLLPYSIRLVLLLAGFALVVEGCDLFGFLSSRAIRLMGAISYPVYLVHGIVNFMAMQIRNKSYPVPLLAYMGQVSLCLIAIFLLAIVIHLVIERPTMKLSEQIARRASIPQTGLLDPAPQAEPAT